MPKKPADKSARKSAPGRPFGTGEDARRGRGPKKGAPNAGRTPDAVRAIARDAYAKRIPTLERFATNPRLDPAVRIKAIAELRAASGLSTITPTDGNGDTLSLEALLRTVSATDGSD